VNDNGRYRQERATVISQGKPQIQNLRVRGTSTTILVAAQVII
jgi:hypothetical protein